MIPLAVSFIALSRSPACSQAKFAVRTETDELEYVVVRFSVNQDQVGLDVTIPVVLPIPTERMIVVLVGQNLIMERRRRSVLSFLWRSTL